MPSLEDWSAPAIAQLEGGTLRPGILFRMTTDPIVRLWAGLGDLTIETDPIEPELGAVYRGIGELTGLPALSQLINGIAERIEFNLAGAGVSSDLAALASGEAAAIRGAAVNIGLLVFDANYQILSPTAWLWSGEADSLQVTRAEDNGQAVRSLVLSVGSTMTGRRRPGLNFFTDPDQRRRSADDAFFDRVALYNRGSTKVWPR